MLVAIRNHSAWLTGLSEIIEYAKGDVFKVRFRDGDTFGSFAVDHKNTVAWTMKEGDKILCCGGFVIECPGVATQWAYFGDEARGYGRQIVKFARQNLGEMIEKYDLRRVQAFCRADRAEYRRFIEMMGFEYEGCLKRAASNGEDLLMYGRI